MAEDNSAGWLVPGGRGSSQPGRGWTRDIKDTLGIKVHVAGELASWREVFRRALIRMAFRKGSATR